MVSWNRTFHWQDFDQNRDWSKYLLDAQDIPVQVEVNDSEHEQSILCDEEWLPAIHIYALSQFVDVI